MRLVRSSAGLQRQSAANDPNLIGGIVVHQGVQVPFGSNNGCSSNGLTVHIGR